MSHVIGNLRHNGNVYPVVGVGNPFHVEGESHVYVRLADGCGFTVPLHEVDAGDE